MSFEVFTEHAVKEECRQMFLELKKADYAVSTFDKQTIDLYAHHFGVKVILRKLKSGQTKVILVKEQS